jgi:hypothetical protein
MCFKEKATLPKWNIKNHMHLKVDHSSVHLKKTYEWQIHGVRLLMLGRSITPEFHLRTALLET